MFTTTLHYRWSCKEQNAQERRRQWRTSSHSGIVKSHFACIKVGPRGEGWQEGSTLGSGSQAMEVGPYLILCVGQCHARWAYFVLGRIFSTPGFVCWRPLWQHHIPPQCHAKGPQCIKEIPSFLRQRMTVSATLRNNRTAPRITTWVLLFGSNTGGSEKKKRKKIKDTFLMGRVQETTTFEV